MTHGNQSTFSAHVILIVVWAFFLTFSWSFAATKDYKLSYQTTLTNLQLKPSTSPKPVSLSQSEYQEPSRIPYQKYAWIFGFGAELFLLDASLNDFSQQRSLHNEDNSEFFGEIEPLGRKNIWISSVPLFLGHALVFRNNKSLLVAGELFVGFQVMNGITYTAKSGFGRKRPFESDSPFEFFEGGSAFYSGHTVNAFTFATIISKNYPVQDLSFLGIEREFPLVPVFCYSTAALVGLQRLYSNSHWASDVYFGALAGYAIGSLMVKLGDFAGKRWLSLTPGDPPMVNLSFNLN